MNNNNKLIYLASPYSSGSNTPEVYYGKTINLVGHYILQGYSIWSPILCTYPVIEKFCLPIYAGYWKKYNEVFISKCNEIWVACFPGWSRSVGVRQEIEQGRILNIPVIFIHVSQDNYYHMDSRPPELDDFELFFPISPV